MTGDWNPHVDLAQADLSGPPRSMYSLLLLSPPFTAGAVRSWSDKCMRIVLDIEEEDIERIGSIPRGFPRLKRAF